MYNICCTKVVYVVSFILYKVGNSKFIVQQYTNYVLSEVTPRAIVGIELNNELAITQISIYIRLSEWCCSVTMVWVQITSREEQKFDSAKI